MRLVRIRAASIVISFLSIGHHLFSQFGNFCRLEEFDDPFSNRAPEGVQRVIPRSVTVLKLKDAAQ